MPSQLAKLDGPPLLGSFQGEDRPHTRMPDRPREVASEGREEGGGDGEGCGRFFVRRRGEKVVVVGGIVVN